MSDTKNEALEFWVTREYFATAIPKHFAYSTEPEYGKNIWDNKDAYVHVIEMRAYQDLKAKHERVLQMLEEASKRSSYQWSEGPDYFPSDYANEGRVALALEILAQIESLKLPSKMRGVV